MEQGVKYFIEPTADIADELVNGLRIIFLVKRNGWFEGLLMSSAVMQYKLQDLTPDTFVKFVVLDGNSEVWASGRTNDIGVILDGNGDPLPSEFFTNGDYQKHYEVISSEDQVQIYEELNQNAQREFTTSFIHRVYPIKDNRLLPDGWRASSNFKKDGELLFEFMEATDPESTGADPDYMDQGAGFKGGDSLAYEITLPDGVNTENLTVRATLYSQSIPPSWLHQRFSTAPEGLATRRLYYMTSHLNLKGTPMENWKLKLVSDSQSVKSE